MSAPFATGGSVAQAVAVSTGAQLVARAAHVGLNLVASLALIRFLGPSGYGDYVFVFSFVTMWGLLSDFGLMKVAVRDMARDEKAAAAILGTSVLGRLALALLCWLLAQSVLLLMGARTDLQLAVAIASLTLASDALLSVTAVFQVRIALQYEALVSVVGQGLETAAIFWLISHDATFLQIVSVPVLGGVVAAGLAAAIARGRFQASVRFELWRLAGLLRDAAPVGLTLLLAVVNWRLDGVLLGAMATPTDVGLYGAAFKPVEYLMLGSAVLMNSMFPLLARWYRADPGRFRLAYCRGVDALLAVAVPIAVVLVLVAQPLVLVLYPPEFAPSALALQLLAVAFVFVVFNAWQGFTLLAGGHQRATLAYDAAALAVNVVLNLALIPRLGYMAPVVAAFATNLLASGCAVWAASWLMGARPDVARVPALVLANAMVGVSLWLLLQAGVPWLAAALLASLPYPACLLLFRVTSREELRLFLPGGPTIARSPRLEVL